MLNKWFMAFILAITSSTAWGASPVLYFSDLTSGPAVATNAISGGLGDGKGTGAIVTIWGVNLGTPTLTSGQPQSGYSISAGGQAPSYIYEWGNATQHAGHPSDLYTWHKMQVIMFSLSGSASGTSGITVTTPSGTTNTLPFTVRSGPIYFVSSTGSDSGNGTGTNGDWDHPWLTPNYFFDPIYFPGANDIPAGSICYVKTNLTYSFDYGVELYRTGGTASNPWFLSAYPGVSVRVNGVNLGFGAGYQGGKTYIYGHVSKITFSAPHLAVTYIEHGRVIGCEVIDSATSPCATSQTGLISSRTINTGPDGNDPGLNGNIMLGNYIHDYCNGLTGDKQQHTWYLQHRDNRANAVGWEVGWNYLNNNWGNFGIHVYDEGWCTNWTTDVSIHDNVVVDQRGSAINVGPHCASGMEVTTTFNVYNNLIVRGGRGPGFDGSTTSLFPVGLGGCSTLEGCYGSNFTINFYNNTIYGYGENDTVNRPYSTGNPINMGAINIGVFSALNIRNNIWYDSNNWPNQYGSNLPTTHTNNLWYSTASRTPPSWDTAPITSNPLFTSIASDFSLQSGSPAVNAGYDTTSVVVRDLIGVARSAVDIGAFEHDTVDTTAPTLRGGIIGRIQ